MKLLNTMETLKILTRHEMKNIIAGNCQVFAYGEWVGDCQVSVSVAQDLYNNDPNVTGYCCASCGTTAQFGNAEPC